MKILNEEEILKFAQKLAYSQNISSKKNKNDKSLKKEHFLEGLVLLGDIFITFASQSTPARA